MPRADRSRRKSSNQLAFVAESESRIQLHCTWCWPKDCQVMMWMFEHVASASWLCLMESITVKYCKYLLWWQPDIMSCGVLKPFTQRCQPLSVTEIPLMRMANWLLRKRFTPKLATTIFRDTTFAQTATTQSFTNRWVLVPAILWTQSPKKTLESIWCEQEDGPISSPGTQSQSFLSACFLICFWTVWG